MRNSSDDNLAEKLNLKEDSEINIDEEDSDPKLSANDTSDSEPKLLKKDDGSKGLNEKARGSTSAGPSRNSHSAPVKKVRFKDEVQVIKGRKWSQERRDPTTESDNLPKAESFLLGTFPIQSAFPRPSFPDLLLPDPSYSTDLFWNVQQHATLAIIPGQPFTLTFSSKPLPWAYRFPRDLSFSEFSSSQSEILTEVSHDDATRSSLSSWVSSFPTPLPTHSTFLGLSLPDLSLPEPFYTSETLLEPFLTGLIQSTDGNSDDDPFEEGMKPIGTKGDEDEPLISTKNLFLFSILLIVIAYIYCIIRDLFYH